MYREGLGEKGDKITVQGDCWKKVELLESGLLERTQVAASSLGW